MWERYANAEYDERLCTDRDLAHRLQWQFADRGVHLEVIHVEVVPPSDDVVAQLARRLSEADLVKTLERLLARHHLSSKPDKLELLGFDLSYPLPTFHSALYQPGLHEVYTRLKQELNGCGLINDLPSAHRLSRFANEIESPWLPFCPLAVYLA